MRILLLNPPYLPRYSRQSRSPCVTKSGTFYYPYFLAYAAGVLEKAGFEVKIIDAVAQEFSHGKTVEEVKKFAPTLVVIDTSTPSIYNDVAIATKIKQVTQAHVTLVGTHPTALPNETLALGKADSICRGEFDYTVRDLALALNKGNKLETVLGLSYRDGKKIIHNAPRPLIKNLDALPFVSEVYLKHFGEKGIKKYFYASLRWPQVTILTARGCPYNCAFCNSPFKTSYRPRSIKNVVAEFKFIKKNLPFVKEIMIEDETFPASKKRTINLCKALVKNKNKLRWSCNARVNTDLETLKWMKKAGCRLLCVGFESPEQSLLNAVHKGTSEKMQIDFMKDTKRTGLLVNGCFILGLPGETKETIRKTIEFAKKLNPDTAQFYPLMVYPGTEAYAWAKKKRLLTTEDYRKWLTKEGYHHTTISRKRLSTKELVALCDLARKEFYVRPRYIIPKFSQVLASPSEAIRTLKSGKTFFKYLVSLNKKIKKKIK
ncbi:MAG: B12-binding domain-containing radical SAM protein [Candidatus Pacearchaeota archaeon]